MSGAGNHERTSIGNDVSARPSREAGAGEVSPAALAPAGLMRKPRLLDLFCCAGGAGMGYHLAGFEVVGVDIRPQPRYPFEFIQADVLTLDPAFLASFDAIHASPPCQIHSITAKLHGNSKGHLDLIPETRAMLIASGRPYVMENVPGAPLVDPITLCGTMFGLRVYRHRLFECSFWTLTPGHHGHTATTNSSRTYSAFATGAEFICVAGNNFRREDGAAAMGIDWHATRPEIAQAIPPAYTEFLGKQLLAHLTVPARFTIPFIADDQAFEDAANEHANRVALACPGELIAPHSQTTSAPGEA